jgi:hypothetical protein
MRCICCAGLTECRTFFIGRHEDVVQHVALDNNGGVDVALQGHTCKRFYCRNKERVCWLDDINGLPSDVVRADVELLMQKTTLDLQENQTVNTPFKTHGGKVAMQDRYWRDGDDVDDT